MDNFQDLRDDDNLWNLPSDTFDLWTNLDFEEDSMAVLENSSGLLLTPQTCSTFDELAYSDLLDWNSDPSEAFISKSDQGSVDSSCDFSIIERTPSPPLDILDCTDRQPGGKRSPPLASHGDQKPPLKRKIWDESIIIFSSKPGEKAVSRRRKQYAPSRRKEVAINRLVGACIQCKIRKGSCNFGIPCDQCIKRAGGISMGQQLCSRQSLVSIRFNDVDLLGISNLRKRLNGIDMSKSTGLQKDVYICWPISLADRMSSFLKIRVQECTGSEGGTEKPLEQPMVFRTYAYSYSYVAHDSLTMIVPESLPSIESLVDIGTEIDCGKITGPFEGLHSAFGEFGNLYCDMKMEMPLQLLLKKCLRMKRLLAVFRPAAYMNGTHDFDGLSLTSSWIGKQLKFHIGQEVMELEAEILTELDRILYGSDTIGKRNPLACWMCIWTLVLAYREHMAYLLQHHIQLDPAGLAPLFGLSKHIYNTLTSIYSALYKTTSPLTFDWRTDEISEMLGKDPGLIKAFCNIKTEMYWFHGAKDQLFDDDELFKTLVVENERKLMASHMEAARKKGFCRTTC